MSAILGVAILFGLIAGLLISLKRQKLASICLQVETNRYKSIIESTDFGTWEWNVQTGQIIANERYFTMLGYSESDFSEKTIKIWEQLAHPADLVACKSALNEHFNGTNDFYLAECRLKHKDGCWRWVLDRGKLISRTTDGLPEWVFGTHTEITQMKDAENTIRKLQIARKTASFKQNFLANMSHEIRTPLTGILGMIEILQETELSEIQKDYLNTIKYSGENLKDIINQVLDFSKIEAGKVSLNPGRFEFKTLPENSLLLFKNNLRNGVDLQYNIDSQIPRWIEADRSRLTQVLNNLVSNAVKFTSQGSICINSSLVNTDRENGPLFIRIEVTDTGIGIPQDQQRNLFVPFSRLKPSIHGSMKGQDSDYQFVSNW